MGYLADSYVIQKSRSKEKAIDFLDHFLPSRVESSNEYFIPLYADAPIKTFSDVDELMIYLEVNPKCAYSIYWRNTNEQALNKHGMLFYTADGYLIFGISREADVSGNLNTKNEDECLAELLAYFKTDMGYIHYEHPPATTYREFAIIVDKLKRRTNS